jgi:hypothetical protein
VELANKVYKMFTPWRSVFQQNKVALLTGT